MIEVIYWIRNENHVYLINSFELTHASKEAFRTNDREKAYNLLRVAQNHDRTPTKMMKKFNIYFSINYGN